MTVALALKLSVEGAEPSGVNLIHVMDVKGNPGLEMSDSPNEVMNISETSLLSSALRPSSPSVPSSRHRCRCWWTRACRRPAGTPGQSPRC